MKSICCYGNSASNFHYTDAIEIAKWVPQYQTWKHLEKYNFSVSLTQQKNKEQKAKKASLTSLLMFIDPV